MLQKHIITVDKTCYVSLNNIFIHFSFFILCNFNTMPIFISISQQPFYISCHILTCMAKKMEKTVFKSLVHILLHIV